MEEEKKIYKWTFYFVHGDINFYTESLEDYQTICDMIAEINTGETKKFKKLPVDKAQEIMINLDLIKCIISTQISEEQKQKEISQGVPQNGV